jgi:hypothetical protein
LHQLTLSPPFIPWGGGCTVLHRWGNRIALAWQHTKPSLPNQGQWQIWLPNFVGLVVGGATCWKLNSIAPIPQNVLRLMVGISLTTLLLQFGDEVTGFAQEESQRWIGVLGNLVAITVLCSGAVTWPEIMATKNASKLEKAYKLQLAGFASTV